MPVCLNRRSPKGREYYLKCNSCYVMLAFFWGDEIKSIVKKAHQEEKVNTVVLTLHYCLVSVTGSASQLEVKVGGESVTFWDVTII